MRKATERLSIRRRLKCKHVDEPADLSTAERLFARLCARVWWIEHVRRPGNGDERLLPEESD